MAAPTVSASLNKATYTPGEPMTLTVNYGDPDNKPVTVTVKVTDAAGAVVVESEAAAVVDALTLTVTDPDRTWTQQSNTGSVAVFTATA